MWDIWQNNWPISPKTVNVMKIGKSLSRCHNPQEPRDMSTKHNVVLDRIPGRKLVQNRNVIMINVLARMRGLATRLWRGKREWELKRTEQKKCKVQEEESRESSLLRGHPEFRDHNPGSEPQPGQSGRVPRHGKADCCRSNARDGARGPQATLVSSGGHHVLTPRNLSPPSGAPPSQFRRPRHRKVAMSQTESHISDAKRPQNLATAILHAWDSMPHAQQWGKATLGPATRKVPCPHYNETQ